MGREGEGVRARRRTEKKTPAEEKPQNDAALRKVSPQLPIDL